MAMPKSYSHNKNKKNIHWKNLLTKTVEFTCTGVQIVQNVYRQYRTCAQEFY